jgi:hypothetical protein
MGITQSADWQRIRAAWPNRLDLSPLPNLLLPSDIPDLLTRVRMGRPPDYAMAHNLLFEAYTKRPELMTGGVLRGWLEALAEAHADVIQSWRKRPSDRSLNALYERFLLSVPVGVRLDDLVSVVGSPTEEIAPTDREPRKWIAYVSDNLALQIWSNGDGQFWSAKLA